VRRKGTKDSLISIHKFKATPNGCQRGLGPWYHLRLIPLKLLLLKKSGKLSVSKGWRRNTEEAREPRSSTEKDGRSKDGSATSRKCARCKAV